MIEVDRILAERTALERAERRVFRASQALLSRVLGDAFTSYPFLGMVRWMQYGSTTSAPQLWSADDVACDLYRSPYEDGSEFQRKCKRTTWPYGTGTNIGRDPKFIECADFVRGAFTLIPDAALIQMFGPHVEVVATPHSLQARDLHEIERTACPRS